MHISRWIWFLVALFFGLLASASMLKMVADVNNRAEESQKYSYFGWYPGKLGRLWEAHRRLVPRSPWRICVVVSFLLAALSIAMAASQP
jgi:hypothetical protein